MEALHLILSTTLLCAAPPATRVAVLIDDPAPGGPARAGVEAALQSRGFEVVAPEVSSRMRASVAPTDLMGARLPEGLSVFEADAIVAGQAGYGDPQEVEGVLSAHVTLTARLIDLGTGRTTTTIQTSGVGIGVAGPTLHARGAGQAVGLLFSSPRFSQALKDVGQEAGMVTLIVQKIPNRAALLELREGLERALAGAPVKEIYYAKGLGKLVLGGSKAKSMVGPDIADVIGQRRSLALEVDEVANTRIVATYDRARTVAVHALVLEPKVPRRMRQRAKELGKYVATRFATFEFARASYQPGRLNRARAIERAKALGAGVIVESEVMGRDGSTALSIRVVDVESGRPIFREQRLMTGDEELRAAEGLLATIGARLPEHLARAAQDAARRKGEAPTTVVATDKE